MTHEPRAAGVRQRRARLGCVALVAVEVVGVLVLLAPIPVAWMWVGGVIYRATGSLLGDLACALFGFLASACAMIWCLNLVDRRWVACRRSLGHDQRDGALTRVVVVTMAVVLPAGYIWFNASGAVVIKFMPTS